MALSLETAHLGLMGVLFITAPISGAVLYAPFTPRNGTGTLRPASSTRLRWPDLHNVIGIVPLAWLAVGGITGESIRCPLFPLP